MGGKVTAFRGPVNPSRNYVYYQHLAKTHPGFLNKLDFNYATNFIQNSDGPDMSIVDKLKNMARAERQKEQDFIYFTFGVKIDYDLNGTTTKDFIDAFNSYMQLQKVYEARKTLLMHGYEDGDKQSLKDAYSYFSSYFLTVWNQNIDSISEEVVDLLMQGVPFDEVLQTAINEKMPELIDLTLDKVSRADGNKTLSDEKRQQVKEALQTMTGAINLFGRTKFGQLVMSSLNLDNVSKAVEYEMKKLKKTGETTNKTKVKEGLKKSVTYLKGSRATHALSGTMQEVMEQVCTSALFLGLKGSKNAKVYSTGKQGLGADTVMVVAEGNIEIENDQIERLLEKGEKTSKAQNRETIEKLQNILEKGNSKGFIVYSSDKNYLRLRKKKDGGFIESDYAGGGKQKLRLFSPILEQATGQLGSASTLMQGIMQTIPGAIGDNNKQYISEQLAQYFAYFLFDDLEFLGKPPDSSNYTKIHLLNLNGIYVPLSAFLNSYAEALLNELTRVKVSPRSVARVTISTPSSIKFNYDNPEGPIPIDAWEQQRDEALDEIQVQLHFLRSLRDILNGVEV